jgi:hypothetical protein
MSRLAEIYKSEKKKGGGLMSALGKRALEKIDPRQMFNQKGLASAIAPSLFKTYSATAGNSSTALSTPTPQISTQNMESKIDILSSEMRIVGNNTRVAAKNSMSLPDMARDMNVMRQNVIKLVKLQGGESTNKADMYFKKSSENEAAYETQFSKQKGVSPTPVTSKEPEKNTGILGFLSTLFAPLLTLGGTIVSAITGALSGLGELILGGLKNILTVENLMKSLGIAKEALMGIVRIATLVATNPVFLAIAGIASAAAILAYMRGNYDSEKERYLELAKKKKETGSLSVEEEDELKRINRPNFQQESRKQLDGYDPITNKIEAVTSVEGITKTNQMNDAQLRNLATEQLANEGKSNASLKDIAERFGKLKKQRETALTSQNDGSMDAAESRRLSNSPKPSNSTPATPSTTPTPMTAMAGGIDPSKTTFNELTREQQDIFMQKQREAEGFKPGSLTYDLNNPGAMLYAPWQRKYGAELDTTGRGVGTVKGLFSSFPTLQDGVEAQRALLSGKKYGNLPLEQAINQWVTGNKLSDVDTNMGPGGEKNTGYKNKIYAALGTSPSTSSGMPTLGTLTATAPSTGPTLTTASVQVASAGQAGTTIINNNTTNNSKTGGGGQGTQGTPNIPSAFDDVFTTLFSRVA